MKRKEIVIEGCATNPGPDDKPCISIHGLEGCGKTRFAATAPDPIGLLALDKKSKRTFAKIAEELGITYIANTEPILSDKDAIKLALSDNVEEIKEAYKRVYEKTLTMGMKFAAHRDIQTIVVDTTSQLFEYIMFSHFGRRNQIKPTSRSAPNQDMIDFINALRAKNVVLIHRSKEIWKNTGKYAANGEPIKEPSGKFEQDGFRGIGGFCTAVVEMTNNKTVVVPPPDEDGHEKAMSKKFQMRVVTCQTNSMLEGQLLTDYGISGADITWDNLLTVLEAA